MIPIEQIGWTPERLKAWATEMNKAKGATVAVATDEGLALHASLGYFNNDPKEAS
jgi:hypothetical protein